MVIEIRESISKVTCKLSTCNYLTTRKTRKDLEMKKFIAMLLVVTTLICPMNAFAKGTDAETTERQGIAVASEVVNTADPQSLGKALASGVKTITGGSGTLSITLPTGNWWADFVVCIGQTNRNDVVTCSVKAPNGNTYNLGSMSGTGSSTDPYQIAYAPAGTYTFYFLTSNTDSVTVMAYIYD